MKLKILVVAPMLSIVFGNASAGQITIPNSFTSGAKAVAGEVNENFSALVLESNSQDSRISAIESSAVAINIIINDQLFCNTPGDNWIQYNYTLSCVQRSDSGSIKSFTLTQILSEGWVSTSVTGRTVLFNK